MGQGIEFRSQYARILLVLYLVHEAWCVRMSAACLARVAIILLLFGYTGLSAAERFF
jgi:hypothetical protein